VHGKEKAKADHSSALYGNMLDFRVRNTQDQQTLGLPVGPDSSFILAEIIGARIDSQLQDKIPALEGSRYVDDFHLYFDSRAEAEAAFTLLAKVARSFELEINDRKTTISEGPDTGEPRWKTAIKAQHIRGKGAAQRSSLISFICKSFELATDYPSQGVLAYAVKKAVGTKIHEDNFDVFESFIRAALVHDSSTVQIVTRVLFERRKDSQLQNLDKLQECIATMCLLHAKAGFSYEVCWLLWLFHVLQLGVPEEVAAAVSDMDDPLVALSALALNEGGMFPSLNSRAWEASMAANSLYTEYWILAYEAARRGWLPTNGDYLSNDPFFGQLAKLGVSFCDIPSDSGVGYIDLPTAGGYMD
jgi:hypothetical protein